VEGVSCVALNGQKSTHGPGTKFFVEGGTSRVGEREKAGTGVNGGATEEDYPEVQDS